MVLLAVSGVQNSMTLVMGSSLISVSEALVVCKRPVPHTEVLHLFSAIPIHLVLEYSAHRITNKAFLVSQEEAYLDNQQVRIQ